MPFTGYEFNRILDSPLAVSRKQKILQQNGSDTNRNNDIILSRCQTGDDTSVSRGSRTHNQNFY